MFLAFFEKKFDKSLFTLYNICFGNPNSLFYRNGGNYSETF